MKVSTGAIAQQGLSVVSSAARLEQVSAVSLEA